MDMGNRLSTREISIKVIGRTINITVKEQNNGQKAIDIMANGSLMPRMALENGLFKMAESTKGLLKIISFMV
jgi:hypothetical protein